MVRQNSGGAPDAGGPDEVLRHSSAPGDECQVPDFTDVRAGGVVHFEWAGHRGGSDKERNRGLNF